MLYDVVIHGITKEVLESIQPILERARIGYVIEPSAAQKYLDESGSWLAAKVGVDKVVTAFKIDPKGAKSHFGWNGSMANKFLRLAGVWDELSKTEKNIILGYEVASKALDERLPDPRDPGDGY